ncbi:hypothetical protein B0H63DRAFT_464922 [Podospora didyma]|uniref:FAD/NAD(P)-binding domain-containing protein n=1 Tax=Podospora didyma TaxID=330526 RepID=A0AAE0NYT9_9PEZI|nr:hypothetical protein B0H63DRAFT_464922 [Podospora didyma]
MAKTVLILGGSFAGLHVAHGLLKKNDKDLKVVLVSKNSHFYWNLASVRAIVPGVIKDEEIFKSLSSALSKYPETSYELIIGSAEAADFDAKTVRISVPGSADRTIEYDQLVLATGSRCPDTSVPWKAEHGYEETIELLHSTGAKVEAAKHIVVAGAGATGIETAGELGFAFGKTKEIVLLCAGDKVLGGDSIAASASNELKKLNVKIEYGAKVESTAPAGEKTEITLANCKDKIVTDLYLPTMGLVPNSEYVNAKYLDSVRKTVNVDEFLRVEGTTNVWAAGDLVSKPRAGFMITQKQAGTVINNVLAALAGREPTVHKGMPFDILACSTGRSRGVGRAGFVKMPSIGVWAVKARQLGINMIPGYINGSVA